jgi:hypothetical protein
MCSAPHVTFSAAQDSHLGLLGHPHPLSSVSREMMMMMTAAAEPTNTHTASLVTLSSAQVPWTFKPCCLNLALLLAR